MSDVQSTSQFVSFDSSIDSLLHHGESITLSNPLEVAVVVETTTGVQRYQTIGIITVEPGTPGAKTMSWYIFQALLGRSETIEQLPFASALYYPNRQSSPRPQPATPGSIAIVSADALAALKALNSHDVVSPSERKAHDAHRRRMPNRIAQVAIGWLSLKDTATHSVTQENDASNPYELAYQARRHIPVVTIQPGMSAMIKLIPKTEHAEPSSSDELVAKVEVDSYSFNVRITDLASSLRVHLRHAPSKFGKD